MKEVIIRDDYIKLGQLLKFISIIGSGSDAKVFLSENKVLVNDVREERRGRKVYKGDVVNVENNEFLVK